MCVLVVHLEGNKLSSEGVTGELTIEELCYRRCCRGDKNKKPTTKSGKMRI